MVEELWWRRKCWGKVSKSTGLYKWIIKYQRDISVNLGWCDATRLLLFYVHGCLSQFLWTNSQNKQACQAFNAHLLSLSKCQSRQVTMCIYWPAQLADRKDRKMAGCSLLLSPKRWKNYKIITNHQYIFLSLICTALVMIFIHGSTRWLGENMWQVFSGQLSITQLH